LQEISGFSIAAILIKIKSVRHQFFKQGSEKQMDRTDPESEAGFRKGIPGMPGSGVAREDIPVIQEKHKANLWIQYTPNEFQF
jgi:hypothetical protein